MAETMRKHSPRYPRPWALFAVLVALLSCSSERDGVSAAGPTGAVSQAASGTASIVWVDSIGTRGTPTTNGDLRGLPGSAGQIAIAKGFWAAGDGGGGEFW